jgi:urease accessory protein
MTTILVRRTILATSGMACALASPFALAHLGTDVPHSHDGHALASFVAGAVHPLTGLDHLAAMVSVGMWSVLGSTQTNGKTTKGLLAAPTAFAGTLLVGALLGMAGLALPGIEPMVAASLLVLGLLVATRSKLPAGLGAALVAVFALFHGLAHGQELGGHAMAALSGMVLSTAALHGLGIGVGLALREQSRQPLRWARRLAGAGVALFGVMSGLILLTPAVAAAI